MNKVERNTVERYLYSLYPSDRYELKKWFYVDDVFGEELQRLYVIEFIDKKIKYPKKLEVKVKEVELLNFE